jgi:hypothetical protein
MKLGKLLLLLLPPWDDWVVVGFGVWTVVVVGWGVGVAAFKMVGVVVGLTLDERAGVDEGGWTEESCLQRLEF